MPSSRTLCVPLTLAALAWSCVPSATPSASETPIDDPQRTSLAVLEGTDWRLIAMAGGPTRLADAALTARFGEGSIRGRGGCNEYRGSASSPVPGSLVVGPLLATKMSCGPALDALERAYLERLEAARTWQRTGDALTIDYQLGSETGALRFETIEARPAAP